ncbi:uncharacterized protein PG998_000141 [Apiospora kogelbergensis]|uniref:uncharacterized protein n=1 Tax=Apiospora kogelbergensis TaxID=1337665 RepID=UPI003131A45D
MRPIDEGDAAYGNPSKRQDTSLDLVFDGKYIRNAEDGKLEDEGADDEQASQALFTGDGQHDDELGETEHSLQKLQIDNNNDNETSLDDDIARVDDQVKKRISRLQQETDRVKLQVSYLIQTTQGQLGDIHNTIMNQNDKVYQTLSVVGKCLQELGNLIEKVVEADRPSTAKKAHDPSTVKADGPSTVKDADGPKRESSGRPGTLSIGPSQYFTWLARLDLRPPQAMVKYADAALYFHEKEVFNWTLRRQFLDTISETYYIIHDVFLPPLDTRARSKRWNRGDKSVTSRSPEERSYLGDVLEMVPAPQHGIVYHLSQPRYVLPLGHLLVKDKKTNDPATWTGYYVVMDVTTPEKAIWAVYCKKTEGIKLKYNYLCPDGFEHTLGWGENRGMYDLIRLAGRVDWFCDTPESQLSDLIARSMKTHKYHVRPFFTVPKLDSLLEDITIGWSAYENVPPTSG